MAERPAPVPLHRAVPAPVDGVARMVTSRAATVGLSAREAEQPVREYFDRFSWRPQAHQTMTAEQFLQNL